MVGPCRSTQGKAIVDKEGTNVIAKLLKDRRIQGLVSLPKYWQPQLYMVTYDFIAKVSW